MPTSEKIASISWCWIALSLAIAAALLSVLIVIDGSLVALGVPGANSLQQASSADEFGAIVTAWRDAGAPALARAGFSLGWDCLFLVSYGTAFTLAGLKSRDELFPAPGLARAIALVAVVLMPLGAALDAVENILQLKMVVGEFDPQLAQWSARVTSVKWVLVTPCMLLALVGVTAAVVRTIRRK